MANQRKAGAVLGYANVIAKNFVNLMYVPLLLHFVGQGDYGVFQMTNSVVFALTLLSAGFSGAYVRFYMREIAHGTRSSVRRLNGIFLLIYLIVVGLCLIGGVILTFNVDLLFSGGLNPRELVLARELMVLMVLNVAAQLMTSPFNSYITAKECFVYQQTRQLLTTLVQPLLAVLLVWRGMGAIGVALAMLVVTMTLLLMNVVYAVKKLGMRFTFTGLQWSMFKAIAVFSFWIFLNQIFDLVNNNVPNFLLGAMAGSTVVATFSIAVQIRNIFFAMSTTMSNVFIPQINRIVADSNDNKVLTQLMTRVGRYQMIIFWFIYGGFIIIGKFFVVLWAGQQNVDAYWLAVIMVFPVMIPLTQNTGIEIQRAKNRHKTRSVIYVFTAVLDVVLSFLLIPSMGYWATAVGYIVSIVLGTGLFMNWYYQTHIGLDMLYFWRNQIPTIIMAVFVTGICLLGTYFVPVNSIMFFLMWGMIYVVLFCIGAFYISLTATERSKALFMLHRKKLIR